MQGDRWLYYAAHANSTRREGPLPAGLTWEMWRPSLFSQRPRGTPAFPFIVWWLFHLAHVFRNREYGLLLIRHDRRIVHRSVVTPGYFRFPFMAAQDLQVGDTWTDPERRGQGLATIALEHILMVRGPEKRTWWYVVRSDNAASIRVVEKAGFALVGWGRRTRRMGLGALGQYRLTELTQIHPGS